MERIEGRTFAWTWRAPRVCEDIEFTGCRFDNYAFSARPDPLRRSVVRRCRFLNCWVHATSLDGAVFEDILVENLGTSARPGWINVFGAAFKHVTLRGKIAALNIQPYFDFGELLRTPIGSRRTGLGDRIIDRLLFGRRHPEREDQFRRLNTAYYETVDWALDIRDAESPELNLLGVPAALVLRDKNSQLVVRRANASDGRWRALELGEVAFFRVMIDSMLAAGLDDVVLAAGKRSKNYEAHLRGLEILRLAGVAEED